MQHLTVF